MFELNPVLHQELTAVLHATATDETERARELAAELHETRRVIRTLSGLEDASSPAPAQPSPTLRTKPKASPKVSPRATSQPRGQGRARPPQPRTIPIPERRRGASPPLAALADDASLGPDWIRDSTPAGAVYFYHKITGQVRSPVSASP
jgi:hypothetical protein